MRTKLKGLNHGWRLFVALALVFSMVPALAVSMAGTAGAVEPDPYTAYGSDFILDEAGGEGGMARWVWDNIVEPDPPGTIDDFHSSNHSAYLKALNQGDSAWVIVTWGCTIGELTGTELSYWYRTAFQDDLGPIMGLAIDTDHNGTPDDYAYMASCPPTSPTIWKQFSVDFADDPTPLATRWNTYYNGSNLDWSDLLSQFGEDAKVLAVSVGYDYYRNLDPPSCQGEAFVDDIVVGDPAVNGQSWDLEPIDKDCVKSELGAALSGNPIQIEVDDMSANVEGHEVLELSTTDPDGATSIFDLAHAPKSVGTTSAYDLGAQLTVTGVAQTPTGGTVTVSETPPATYPVFPTLIDCAHAEMDMNPSLITLTTATQLTVTTTNHEDDGPGANDPDCVETAPGANEFLIVTISGTNELGTHIDEVLFFTTQSELTTTQNFKTIYALEIDAVHSANSAATALFIAAENHVWVTYDWHQHDTVTVCAQAIDETGASTGEVVAVELIEVDPITLEPDKDSGYFKGILYPVTTDTNVEPSLIPGLQRHDLEVPHCNTIELKYPDQDLFLPGGPECAGATGQDIFDTFKVDNVPPVFSNQSPTSTNLSQPEISVDISDTKCDVTKEKIHLYVSSVDDDPPFDPGDKVAPADFDFTAGTVTYTPSSPLVDGVYYVRVKAADCCWNWAEIDWSFEVESTPPRMIDAITGWGWHWSQPRGPQNMNLRNTIMVVFSEPLDPTTVEPSDFRVNNIAPVDVEYHDYNGSWPGHCGDGSHAYGLVFLYLAQPMKTDATPTVKQFGVVEDLAGNPCDKYYKWECPLGEDPVVWNYLNDPPPQEVTAQDGIAPAITVTASPEEPGYNETVTVTAVASECLSEAYLFVGTGMPDDYNWGECKPIGWGLFGPDVPCSATGHVSPTTWEAEKDCDSKVCTDWGCCHHCKHWEYFHGEWMPMTLVADQCAEGSKTWEATFTNEFGPKVEWFVEVAAHDFTQWWVDMDDPADPGTWYDYECDPHEKRWKHEKWTQESLIMWGVDALFLELCEGWNLISVPWDLAYPSVQDFFSRKTNSGVTMVYYYQPPTYAGGIGTWKSTFLDLDTGLWSLYGGLTTIEPGKAYWVWVSPPWMELVMEIVEPDPIDMMAPPTYQLKQGWNMIGYTDIDWLDEDRDIEKYLVTLTGNATLMYRYRPCDYEWDRSYVDPDDYEWDWHGDFDDVDWGLGYWLFLMEDGLLAP